MRDIIVCALGAAIAANLLAYLLFVLFARLPGGRLRASIQRIIYALDKAADNMENAAKRAVAIQQVRDILGWRRIFVPAALIGWVIDAEVAVIRRMQQATGCPDLHQDSPPGPGA